MLSHIGSFPRRLSCFRPSRLAKPSISLAFRGDPRSWAISRLSFANFLGVIVLRVIPRVNHKKEALTRTVRRSSGKVPISLTLSIKVHIMLRMNKLPVAKRVQILSMLVEGSSMRSISRVCDASINTVSKILIDAGTVCAAFHDEKVRAVKSQRVQCDEIWSFCYAKAVNVPAAKAAPDNAGDVWTWTAIDADSKLIVSWLVGGRDAGYATEFLYDLKARLATRVQLTTDGHGAYLRAVEDTDFDVDYSMLVKLYGKAPDGERRYSPPICTGIRKHKIMGDPDPAHVSTSYAERQNLQMRMSTRRFTRLTNAHSKKVENHCHALALYFMFYNWIRIHKTLRVTPAMASGLTDKLMSMEDVVALIDAVAAKPDRPKLYKRRVPQISN